MPGITLASLIALFLVTGCEEKKEKEEKATESDTSATSAVVTVSADKTTILSLSDNVLEAPVGALEVGATLSLVTVADPDAFTAIYAIAPKGSAAVQLMGKNAAGVEMDTSSGQLQLTLGYNPNLALIADKTAANLCVVATSKDKKYLWRPVNLRVDETKRTVNIYTKHFGIYQVVFCGSDKLDGFEDVSYTAPSATAGGASGNDSFLKMADFAEPAAVSELPSSSLPESINNISDFYNNEPADSASSGTEEDPCKATTQISAAGDTLTLSINNDKTACEQQHNTDSTRVINKSIEKSYLKVVCVGSDLSSYNGKTEDQLPDDLLQACPTATTVKLLINLMADWQSTYTITAGDQTSTMIESGSMKFGEMSDEGTECIFTIGADKGMTINGCNFVALLNKAQVTHSQEIIYNIYQKLKANNLVGSATGTYYSSGTQSFTIQNWTGTMTYTGESVAPTWTATNKAGETASGTYLQQTSQFEAAQAKAVKPTLSLHNFMEFHKTKRAWH
jgi:hypothetical protein